MNKLLLTLSIAFLCFTHNYSQSKNSIPEWREEQLGKIQKLIQQDAISQLADLVVFPIKRRNPIPNINSKEEFILYYSTLFDNKFKQEFGSSKFTSDNTIDRGDHFGALSGKIWINVNGEIISINHHSEKEKLLYNNLNKEQKSLIHTSVNKWKKNIITAHSDKFIIRIDLDENNQLRYASWSKTKKTSDKPDLVLYNGNQDFHGTMGGIIYTFKNGNWTYIVDRVDMCETEEECGMFLKLLFKDKEKLSSRLQETKN